MPLLEDLSTAAVWLVKEERPFGRLLF